MRKINYNQSSFWEEKYKQSVCEWYQWLYPSKEAISFLKDHLPEDKEIKILQLGCGTSNLGEKLCGLGYNNITCLDFSKQVIKHLKNKNKLPIKYICHNIIEPFPFQEKSFDVIIDKNTIDCVFCFDDYPKKILKCMKQCYRILNNEGVFLSISHGKPKQRKFFFRNKISPFAFKCKPLKIRVNAVEDKKILNGKQQLKKNQEPSNYLYICSKSEGNSQNQGDDSGDNYRDLDIQSQGGKIEEKNEEEQNQIDEKGDENQQQKKQDEGQQLQDENQSAKEPNEEGPNEEEPNEQPNEENYEQNNQDIADT